MIKRAFVTIYPGFNGKRKTRMRAKTFFRLCIGYAFDQMYSVGFDDYICRRYKAKKENKILREKYVDIIKADSIYLEEDATCSACGCVQEDCLCDCDEVE